MVIPHMQKTHSVRPERRTEIELGRKYSASKSNPGLIEQYDSSVGFPEGIDELGESGFKPPATTFYADENDGDVEKWEKFWAINTGAGDVLIDSPVDEVDSGFKFDPAFRDKVLNSKPVLELVPQCRRNSVWSRVNNTELRGFNSHYRGLYGALIGSCLVEMYDDFESMLDSKSDHTYQRAREYWQPLRPEPEKSFRPDVDDLAKFSFGKWGGDA